MNPNAEHTPNAEHGRDIPAGLSPVQLLVLRISDEKNEAANRALQCECLLAWLLGRHGEDFATMLRDAATGEGQIATAAGRALGRVTA